MRQPKSRVSTGRQALPWFPLSVWTVAMASALPLPALAYSVGEADLLSGYAQPLRVQVPVQLGSESEAQDASDITVRLLPLSAYGSLGLTAPPIAPELVKLNVSGSGLLYQVELSSRQLVREPFLTFMLEVRIGGVRVMRELPLIFDLPGGQLARSSPPPAVAQETPTQPSLETRPAPAEPALPAPVATGARVEEKQTASVTQNSAPSKRSAPRSSSRRQETRSSDSRARNTSRKAPMFQLADWNPGYTASSAPLPRFQLAMTFDSYQRLVAEGRAPQPAAVSPEQDTTNAVPATAPVAAIAAPAVPEQAAQVAPKVAPPPAAPQAAAPEEEESSFVLPVALGLLLAGAAAFFHARRRRTFPAPVMEQELPLRESEPSAEMVAAKPALIEPAPVTTTVIPPMTPPTASPSEVATTELRARVAEILNKTMDTNHRRKLQLVEAYLDLGRIESARTLLSELESDLQPKSSSRVPFTLIKG